MKRLNERIRNCYDCPYVATANLIVSKLNLGNIVIYCHKRANVTIIQNAAQQINEIMPNLLNEGGIIPEWCPLPDEEQPQ